MVGKLIVNIDRTFSHGSLCYSAADVEAAGLAAADGGVCITIRPRTGFPQRLESRSARVMRQTLYNLSCVFIMMCDVWL